jgi:hypothetical protein
VRGNVRVVGKGWKEIEESVKDRQTRKKRWKRESTEKIVLSKKKISDIRCTKSIMKSNTMCHHDVIMTLSSLTHNISSLQ